MNVLVNPKQNEGFAETWPVNEEGSPDYKRPSQFPIDRPGVEIKNPEKFTAEDYAAEVFSHVDPNGIKASKDLLSSMSQSQIEEMKRNAGDYKMSKDMGMSEDEALRNSAMAVMRGYVFGQWPKEALDSLKFSPKQIKLLENAKQYAITGN